MRHPELDSGSHAKLLMFSTVKGKVTRTEGQGRHSEQGEESPTLNVEP